MSHQEHVHDPSMIPQRSTFNQRQSVKRFFDISTRIQVCTALVPVNHSCHSQRHQKTRKIQHCESSARSWAIGATSWKFHVCTVLSLYWFFSIDVLKRQAVLQLSRLPADAPSARQASSPANIEVQVEQSCRDQPSEQATYVHVVQFKDLNAHGGARHVASEATKLAIRALREFSVHSFR